MGPTDTTPSNRLVSLDQFRGYTVAGMFFVNYAGGFEAIPAVLKHHNIYCSYADTIMPQFLFAVGFALRLVLLRNRATLGVGPAYGRALRRIGLLLLVGFVFYQVDWEGARGAGWWHPVWKPVTIATLWRDTFETLVHIAVTSLWVLPVIAGSARARLAYGVASAAAHVALSAWFWYALLHEKRVIDGGPLGFLTWTIPALAGSFAHDFRQGLGARPSLRPLLGWGVALMAAGYGLSCLGAGGPLAAAPFVAPTGGIDLWTMSQRAGSVSYLTFAAGFSMAVYAGFVWLCDLRRLSSPFFAILGANALAAYVIHAWVDVPFSAMRDKNDPLWMALLLSAGFIAVSTGLVRALNRRGWYVRL